MRLCVSFRFNCSFTDFSSIFFQMFYAAWRRRPCEKTPLLSTSSCLYHYLLSTFIYTFYFGFYFFISSTSSVDATDCFIASAKASRWVVICNLSNESNANEKWENLKNSSPDNRGLLTENRNHKANVRLWCWEAIAQGKRIATNESLCGRSPVYPRASSSKRFVNYSNCCTGRRRDHGTTMRKT